MSEFRKNTIKGILWMGGLRGVNRGLGLVRIGILARLLTPDQFGLFGIGLLILGFLELATDTGVNVFLIQEKSKIEKYLNSAWVVSIGRGVAIALIIAGLSPFIAGFFNAPNALPVILLISVVPLIRGFLNPAVVKFQKGLEFNKEFYKESVLFVVETIVAVSVGLLTRSETALIWGMIVSATFEVVISFVFVRPWPRLKSELAQVKTIIGRGKWVSAAGTFDYLFTHLDDIVVGRLLGTAPLGLYQQAYKIASLPTIEAERIFNKVTFPTYASISADKLKLKRSFLTTTAAIALLTIPFGILLIIFTKEAILLFLGENWLGIEAVLKVLVVYGVIKAIVNSANSLFLALNKQEVVTLTTFINILGLSVTIIPLLHRYGVVGVAYSVIIGTLLSVPFALYYLRKVFIHT